GVEVYQLIEPSFRAASRSARSTAWPAATLDSNATHTATVRAIGNTMGRSSGRRSSRAALRAWCARSGANANATGERYRAGTDRATPATAVVTEASRARTRTSRKNATSVTKPTGNSVTCAIVRATAGMNQARARMVLSQG